MLSQVGQFLWALIGEIFRPFICLFNGIRRTLLFKRLEKQSITKADTE